MILIYSNTGEWGGVDVLIARFAAYLLKRKIDFRILEPKSGRLRSQAPERVFIDLSQVDDVAAKVTHVLFPSVSKLRDPVFPWRQLAHAHALAWVVHPNDVFRGFFPLSGQLFDLIGYRSIKLLRFLFEGHASIFDSYFLRLTDEAGLIVMDGATLRTLHYFVPVLAKDPELVPIPAVVPDQFVRRTPDGVLRVGYLGRMDSMKWSAVEPFVRYQLAPLSKVRPMEFMLVTEGDKVAHLTALCRKLDIPCTTRGFMPNEEARRWISSNTDVVVAMGTSALDMAGAGHPSVVLDPASGMRARHQEKFRFIQEVSDFTLGEYRDFPGYVEATRSFEECVVPKVLAEAADTGREYVMAHHDPEFCFNKLLNCLYQSSVSISRLERETKRLLDSFQSTKASPLHAAFAGRLAS